MKAVTTTLACWFVSLYIRLVYYTSIKKAIGTETLYRYFDEKKPFIIAFWHGRMLMMPMLSKHKNDVYVIISRHGDGELVARMIEHLRLKTIRGSSNRMKSKAKGSKDRGGVQALKAALNCIKNGDSICITPDGPKGPRQKAKGTILDIARLSGVPIIPVAHSQSRRFLLRSWDAFMIPLPFCHSVMMAGEPIHIPKDASESALEKTRQFLEDQLRWQTDVVDYMAGHAPR